MINKAGKSRQKRKDPIQEEIVSRKDALNDRTTKLIDFIKELKRGWNGGPAPLIGIDQKNNLTSALPDQVIGAGQAAYNEFSAILNGLKEIKTMQDSYANERDRKISERTKNIQQAALESMVIEKFASNMLSRMWAHVVAPFSSEKGKWERLRLLRALGRIDENLEELNDKVLGNDSEIIDAVYLAKQLYLDAKSSFFESFQDNLNKMLEITQQEAKAIEEELKKQKSSTIVPKDGYQVSKAPGKELKDGPVRIPNPKKPEDTVQVEPTPEKGPTAPTISDTILSMEKNIDKLNSTLKGNVRVPVSVPSDKKKTEEEAVQAVVPEAASQPEEIVEQPKQEPSPEEIKQKLIGNKKFILELASSLYSRIREQRANLYTAPSPLGERVYSQWSKINSAVTNLQNSKNLHSLIQNYLIFVKAVGDLTVTIPVIQNELSEKQANPDFVLGSTLKEDKLEGEALAFLDTYKEELRKRFEESIKVEAANRFSRFFKRMVTNLSSDKAKHIRLRIDKDIKTSRDGLENMMNNLERRNINFRGLISQSDLFYSSIIDIFDKLIDLAEMYNSVIRMEKAKKENQSGFNIIPVTDISMLRSIKTKLEADKNKIVTLDETETIISNLSKQMQQLKAPEVESD